MSADPLPPAPVIPPAILARLLALFTPEQLKILVEHGEVVNEHGHGQLTVTWRDGKPDLIYHQASDRV